MIALSLTTLVCIVSLDDDHYTNIILVPIYDARGKNFGPGDLIASGPKNLPLFKQDDRLAEIPYHSLALICYTVFRRRGEDPNSSHKTHLINFNVHWVAVLASPTKAISTAAAGTNDVEFESDSEN